MRRFFRIYCLQIQLLIFGVVSIKSTGKSHFFSRSDVDKCVL